MSRKRTFPTVVAAILATLAFVAAAQVPPEVRARAAGIEAALDRIESEARPSSPRAGSLPAAPGARSLTFTEAEFNAYIACRLADTNEAYVKSAELKLLAGNRFEGHIAIDLGKPQAAGLLPQKQDLLFAGRFESREGQIRVELDSLYLGTQSISPALIDMVIEIVSRLQGVEPTSLKDWYDLPSGVDRLETQKGKVVIVY
jgi:hypothetical protein